MIKTCHECGRIFKTENIKKIYCGDECRKIKLKEKKEIREKLETKKEKRERLKTQKERSWKYVGIKDMTIERYSKLLLEQNNNCGICGINDTELKYELYVDHDHSNGKVRGLLCNRCNQGIGKFRDNIDILASAISFLQQEVK